MSWNPGAGGLLMAFAVVGIVSYIVAMALDAVMAEDGFGVVGNAVITTIGFFAAVYAGSRWGVRPDDLAVVVVIGLVGSLASLGVLMVLKAALDRL